MPALKHRVPKYALHKTTGQARVRLGGKDHYLGSYGSAESKVEYDRLIAQWRLEPESTLRTELTVSHLCLGYLKHAETYYVKHGRQTSEVDCIKSALRRLRKRFGTMPIREFHPKHLRAIMEGMANEGLTRGFCNKSAGRIRRAFAWGVENDMVSGSAYAALGAVKGLRKGRTSAKDNGPVRPVEASLVESTLPYLPKATADLIRVLLLTGARPHELFQLSPGAIDRSGEIWIFTPPEHKTEHHGLRRTICFGPRAQAIITKYLLRAATAPCFERQSGGPFERANLSGAIHRACRKAGLPHWTPYRLRHTHATDVRAVAGLEGAQAALGHRRASTTEIYAEIRVDRAAEIARRLG